MRVCVNFRTRSPLLPHQGKSPGDEVVFSVVLFYTFSTFIERDKIKKKSVAFEWENFADMIICQGL